jgi:hypothetical protein
MSALGRNRSRQPGRGRHRQQPSQVGRELGAQQPGDYADGQHGPGPPGQAMSPAGAFGGPPAPILMLGGGAGPADAGPHPHRHHRPAGGRPPLARPGHQALVLIVVLMMVEVGEQGLEVAVAEGPDRDARRLLVAGGPQVIGVRLGIGHGWPPSQC